MNPGASSVIGSLAGISTPAAPRDLKGHSGARLMLLDTPLGRVVRKGAGASSQNERLRAQCDKLRAGIAAGIACPAVLDSGEEDGLFRFDMEFVPAESLAHAVISGKSLDWGIIVPQIRGLLDRYLAGAGADIPADAFRDKLTRIGEQCATNPHVAACLPEVAALVSRLRDMDWAGIPHSACHGDLTLENMLLRQDSTLVFIDFDVPEHSSWQLDIAKLYQDVAGHWCLRSLALAQPDSMELLNAQLALGRVAALLAPAIATLMPGGVTRICQLSSLHLMRTLPYSRDPRTPGFVVRRIAALLDQA